MGDFKFDLPKVQLVNPQDSGSVIATDKDTGVKTEEKLVQDTASFKFDLPKVTPGFGTDMRIETPYDVGTFPETDIQEYRGEHQPASKKLGIGLWNTGVQMMGDMGKGASYLLDVPMLFRTIKGTEEKFTNDFVDKFDKFEKNLSGDVYRTRESYQGGDRFTDAGYWADMMPSLGSTVSLMIPSLGLTKLTGGLAKLARGKAALEALGMGIEEANALKGITAAVYSRIPENFMESFGTAQETYEDAQKRGLPESTARKLAGEAGRQNWMSNTTNLIFDIPQYMLAFKTFSGAKKYYDKLLGFEAVEAGLEGVEEMKQAVSNKEAQRDALIKEGVIKDDNSTYTDRLMQYASSTDFWDNAVGGFLGGGVFGGVSYFNRKKNDAAQKRMQDTFFEDLKNKYGAVLKNDKGQYEDIDDKQFLGVLHNAAATGSIDKFREHLEKMKDEVFYVQDKEEHQDASAQLAKRLKDLDNYKSNSKKVMNEFIPDEIKPMKAYYLTAKQMLEQRLQETENRIQKSSYDDVVEGNITQGLSDLRNEFMQFNLSHNKNKEQESILNEKMQDVYKDEIHPEITNLKSLHEAFLTSQFGNLSIAHRDKANINAELEDVSTNIKKTSTKAGQDELLKLIKSLQEAQKDIDEKETKEETKPAPTPVETNTTDTGDTQDTQGTDNPPAETYGAPIGTAQRVQKEGIEESGIQKFPLMKIEESDNGEQILHIQTPDGVQKVSSFKGWKQSNVSHVKNDKELLNNPHHFDNLFSYNQHVESRRLNTQANEVHKNYKDKGIDVDKEDIKRDLIRQYPEAYPTHVNKIILDKVLQRPDYNDFLNLRVGPVQGTADNIVFSGDKLRGVEKTGVHIILEITAPEDTPELGVKAGDRLKLVHPYNPDFYEEADEKGNWKPFNIGAASNEKLEGFFGFFNNPDPDSEDWNTLRKFWRNLKEFDTAVKQYYADNAKKGTWITLPKESYSLLPIAQIDFVNPFENEISLDKHPLTKSAPVFGPLNTQVPITLEDYPEVKSGALIGRYSTVITFPNGVQKTIQALPKTADLNSKEASIFIGKLNSLIEKVNSTPRSTSAEDVQKLVQEEKGNFNIAIFPKDVRFKVDFYHFLPSSSDNYILQAQLSYQEGNSPIVKRSIDLNSSFVDKEGNPSLKPFLDLLQGLSTDKNKKRFEIPGLPLPGITRESFRLSIPYPELLNPTSGENPRGKLILSTSEKIIKDWSLRFSFNPDVLYKDAKKEEPKEEVKSEKGEFTPDELETIKFLMDEHKYTKDRAEKTVRESRGESPFFSTHEEYNPDIDYSEAEAWMKEHLPADTHLKDMQEMVSNFKINAIPIGLSLGKAIYLKSIEGKVEKGTLYHEAFHTVFNSLISPVRRQAILSAIKRDMDLSPSELQRRISKMIEQIPALSILGDKILENRIYEEELADRYAAYQKNSDSVKKSWLRELFDKIKDFVNWIAGREDVQKLFRDIEKGKFKNAEFNENSIPLFKLLPGLTASTSDQVFQNVRALMFSGLTFDEAWNAFLKQYDIKSSANTAFLKEHPDKLGKMLQYHNTLNKAGTKELLQEKVNKYTKELKFNPLTESTEDSQEVNEEGEHSDTNYEEVSIHVDPSDGINTQVKNFIGSTVFNGTDIFGREVLMALPWRETYNRLLPVLSISHTDPENIMSTMEEFSKWSPKVKALYDRLAKVTGYSAETPDGVSDEQRDFLYLFKKAFEVHQNLRPQVVVKTDDNSTSEDENPIDVQSTGKLQLFFANKYKLGENRFRFWHENYSRNLRDWSNNPSLHQEAIKDIDSLVSLWNGREGKGWKYSGKSTEEVTRLVLGKLGIVTSDNETGQSGYVTYSFSPDSPEAVNFKNTDTNNYFLTGEDLRLFGNAIKNLQDPFVEDKNNPNSMAGKFQSISYTEAKFDDSLILPTYRDAQNKTVYSYSLPNLVSTKINELKKIKDKKDFEAWKEKYGLKEYWEKNPLFSREYSEVQSIINNLQFGLGLDLRDEDTDRGVTAKNTDSDALSMTLHGYFMNQNPKGAFFWMGQIADKSTQPVINLPVGNYFNREGFTESAENHLWNLFLQEADRISGKYKMPFKNKGFAVYNFLNSEEHKELIQKALKEPSLYKNEVMSLIKNELLDQIESHIEHLSENTTDGKELMQVLLPGVKEKYNSDTDGYIANFIINDFLNSVGIYQIIGGDFAWTSSFDDVIKRASRIIASGYSAGNGNHKVLYIKDKVSYSKPNEGETLTEKEFKRLQDKNPKEASKYKEITENDAQVYTTIGEYAKTFNGYSKLSPEQKKLLQRLDPGIHDAPDFPSFWELKKAGVDLISAKEVTAGENTLGYQVYHKMSVHPLDVRDIGTWNAKEQTWEAKPERVNLFNRWKAMKEHGITHMVPKSASKMFFPEKSIHPDDFNSDVNIKDSDIYSVPNIYRRLQLENYSKDNNQIVHSNQFNNILGSEISSAENIELKKDYDASMRDLRKQSFDITKNLLVSKVNPQERANLDKILRYWQSIIESSTPDNQQIELLESENGDFKYDSNIPHLNQKFQDLFLSTYKKVFRLKVPGIKFTAISPDGYNIIDSETGEIRALRGMRLGENGWEPAEILIPRKFSELHGLNEGDLLNGDLLKLICTRIPTQSYHSIATAKVVGFIEGTYGDSIIAPKDFIQMMGMDFDVDALYSYMKKFYKNSEGEIVLHGTETSPEARFEGFLKDIKDNVFVKQEWMKKLKALPDYQKIYDKLNEKLDKIKSSKDKISDIRFVKSIQKNADVHPSIIKFFVNLDYDKIQSGNFDEDLIEEIFTKNALERTLAPLKELLEYLKTLRQNALLDTLREFDLPSSAEQLEKGSFKTSSALWNKMFDSAYKILSSKELEKAFKEPLQTTEIKRAIGDDKTVGYAPEEEKPHISGTLGSKLYAYENAVNSIGLRGTIVNINTFGQYAQEKGLVLKDELGVSMDGETHISFLSKNPRFKADISSMIVGLIIDDMKNPITRRLNWNNQTINKIGVLIQLGVNPDTAYKWALQPEIKKLFKEYKQSSRSILPVGFYNEVLANHLDETLKKLKSLGLNQQEIESIGDSLTEEELSKFLRIPSKEGDYLYNNAEDKLEFWKTQLKALLLFEKLDYIINNGTSPITRILSTNRQLARDWNNLEDILQAREQSALVFNNSKESIDDSPVLKENLKNAQTAKDSFSLFKLDATEYSREIYKRFRGSAPEPNSAARREKQLNDFNRSLNSAFVSAVLSKHWGKSHYDNISLLLPGEKSLASKVQRIKEKYGTKNNPYLRVVTSQFADAEVPYDILGTDSRTKFSSDVQETLMDGFKMFNAYPEVYGSLAKDHLKYWMLKDGAQFKNLSSIKMADPEIFLELTDLTKKLNKALVKYTPDGDNTKVDKEFKELTGMSLKEFSTNFIENTFRHKVNRKLLPYQAQEDLLNKYHFSQIQGGFALEGKVKNEEFPEFIRIKGLFMKVDQGDNSAKYQLVEPYGDGYRLPYALSPAENEELEADVQKERVRLQKEAPKTLNSPIPSDANESSTKKVIGIRGGNAEYSSQQRANILKRLKDFNRLHGTAHSIDWKLDNPQADLWKADFNFNPQTKLFNKASDSSIEESLISDTINQDFISTYMKGEKTQNSLSLLEDISKNSTDSLIRQIAKSMMALKMDSKFNVPVTGIEHLMMTKKDGTKVEAGGVWRASSKSIEFNLNVSDVNSIEKSILHEIVHSWTDAYLTKHPEKRAEVQALLDHTLSQMTDEEKKKFEYELQDVDEFLAGAFSNEEFIKTLALKKGHSSKSSSILRDFINIIKKFLGMKDSTVLDNLYAEFEDISRKANEESISENQVSYTFKAVKKIQDNLSKILQWEKQVKTPPVLWEKLQQDLQIPKEQLELLKSTEGKNIEEKLVNFLSNYSYTIEINTAKSDKMTDYDEYVDGTKGLFLHDGDRYEIYKDSYLKNYDKISKEEYDKAFELTRTTPSKYYSNMTVPGGTNYTENEISIPQITPSIKGHAQFSTDNGIGWFRSDEKNQVRYLNEKPQDLQSKGGNLSIKEENSDYILYDLSTKEEIYRNTNLENVKQFKADFFKKDTNFISKTRRILEVQSDLFQKARKYFDTDYGKNLATWKGDRDDFPDESDFSRIEKGNAFLQLLLKDNNWVTFFIKSIVQDSAKKGYENVLFPSGNTASKVEGHETLEQFKEEKESRLKTLITEYQELNGAKIEQESDKNGKFYRIYLIHSNGVDWIPQYGTFLSKKAAEDHISAEQFRVDTEIDTLKNEIKRVETEGFAALAPIFKFYEVQVKNILKKNYKVNEVTDEYGNTWNEVTLTSKHKERILFSVIPQVTQEEVDQNTDKKFLKILKAQIEKYKTLEKELSKAYSTPGETYYGVQQRLKIVQAALNRLQNAAGYHDLVSIAEIDQRLAEKLLSSEDISDNNLSISRTLISSLRNFDEDLHQADIPEELQKRLASLREKNNKLFKKYFETLKKVILRESLKAGNTLSWEDIEKSFKDEGYGTMWTLSPEVSHIPLVRLVSQVIEKSIRETNTLIFERDRQQKDFSSEDVKKIFDKEGHLIQEISPSFLKEERKILSEAASVLRDKKSSGKEKSAANLKVNDFYIRTHDYFLSPEGESAYKRELQSVIDANTEVNSEGEDITNQEEVQKWIHQNSWESNGEMDEHGNFFPKFAKARAKQIGEDLVFNNNWYRFLTRIPKEEYINPEFSKVKDLPVYQWYVGKIIEAQSMIPHELSFDLGMYGKFLNHVQLDAGDNKFNLHDTWKGVKGTALDWFTASINLQQALGEDFNSVDEKGRPKAEVKSGSLKDFTEKDPFGLLKKFYDMAVTYKHKQEVQPVLEVLQACIEDAQGVKVNKLGVPLKNPDGTLKSPEKGGYRNAAEMTRFRIYSYLTGKSRFDTGKGSTDVSEEEIKNLQERVEKGEENPQVRKFSAVNTADTLIDYTRALLLGGKIFTAGANYIFGTVSSYIYASRNAEIDAKSLDWANLKLFNSMAKFYTDIAGMKNNEKFATSEALKIMNLSHKYLRGGLVEDEGEYFKNPSHVLNTISKFLLTLQEGGEYLIHNAILLGMMKKTVITDLKGKNRNLYEAHNSDGSWNTKEFGEQPEWTNETHLDETGLNVSKLSKFNTALDNIRKRSQGDYITPMKAKSLIGGRLLGLFRTWIPAYVRERFGEENLALGFKGRYISFLDAGKAEIKNKGILGGLGSMLGKVTAVQLAMLSDLPVVGKYIMQNPVSKFAKESYEKSLKEMGLTDLDIENMRANLQEMHFMVFALGIAFALGGIGGDNEPDDQYAIFGANMASRVYQDLSFFVSVPSAMSIVKNPLPIWNTLQNFNSVVISGYNYLENPQKDILKKGPHKGESKLKRATGKLIPAIAGWYSTEAVFSNLFSNSNSQYATGK